MANDEGRKAGFDKAALDALLSEAIESGELVGASALVFDEGETVYTGTFGLRDRENSKPVELDTLFRIYSMTKPITSAIIMDLQEEGLLNINDPVTKYIPELGDMKVMSAGEDGKPIFTPQENIMTVKDLLLHRAGLGYGIFGPINPVEELYTKAGLFNPTEDLSVKMTKLSKLPLIAQPGTGWYYSYSIDVLGRVIEVVTGNSLIEVMDARIFTPLGMTETSFAVREDQKPRFVSTYALQEDGSYRLFESGDVGAGTDVPGRPGRFSTANKFLSGGGGLVSTLGDYAKFAEMLLNGGVYKGQRILDEATIDAMMTDQMDPDDIYMFPWLGGETNNGFGYGGSIVVADTPEQIARNGQSKGHWGWNGAARTTFWVDRPNGAFGILMLQFFGGDDPDIHRRFRVLVQGETSK